MCTSGLQLQNSLWHSIANWCKQAVDGSCVHIHIWLTETALTAVNPQEGHRSETVTTLPEAAGNLQVDKQ